VDIRPPALPSATPASAAERAAPRSDDTALPRDDADRDLSSLAPGTQLAALQARLDAARLPASESAGDAVGALFIIGAVRSLLTREAAAEADLADAPDSLRAGPPLFCAPDAVPAILKTSIRSSVLVAVETLAPGNDLRALVTLPNDTILMLANSKPFADAFRA
jgi:hypothetical protein